MTLQAQPIVLSADSMTKALAALPAADCDGLISDIGLPDGDGWTLVRRRHLLKPINPKKLDAALEEAARMLPVTR